MNKFNDSDIREALRRSEKKDQPLKCQVTFSTILWTK